MVLTCFCTGKNDGSENNTMVSFGEKAVYWGKETFEYFRALAKPLASAVKSGTSSRSEEQF
ncbi:transcriptional regulator FilR1 domain-containing protein [Methanosarcina horonobensis]|nr:transcriptional regulator FilR1 domain-containing protein [Methanosarcina horonobensis]